MSKETRFDLQERLLDYAAAIIRITERMPHSPAGLHVANQLLRSGTSPLPNHGEAEAAESPRDFVHKLRLCLKELRESERWLLLIKRARLTMALEDVDNALLETDELIRIFVASIRTSESKQPRKQRSDR